MCDFQAMYIVQRKLFDGKSDENSVCDGIWVEVNDCAFLQFFFCLGITLDSFYTRLWRTRLNCSCDEKFGTGMNVPLKVSFTISCSPDH